ncbi:MAG: MATE family efflux transporter [Prevotella sp.]|nr:MATE family efflux transporter [Prevotella sp.]
MFSKVKSDFLLSKIRDGGTMTSSEKLNLIYLLSIPSILAQVTSVMMFFIDQAMVGRISVEAAAACGLVESSMWLCGSMTSAASMGFSVQVAHFIGANDFRKARDVFRHALVFTLLFSFFLGIIGLLISSRLPYWLGGGADIAGDATTYFSVFMLVVPFFQLNGLSGAMLKCSGNMRIPSVVSVMTCVLDVTFNYIFIFIFHLGVLGIALGTALAVVIGACVQAYYAIFRSDMLALLGSNLAMEDREKSLERGNEESRNSVQTDERRGLFPFTPNWDYIVNAVKISAPMAAQSVLMSGAQIVSTIIVAPLGNFAIAANTFAITAESLCYMPGYGIGEAATTLIGQSMGAMRRDLCRSFARMTVFCGMVVMALMGVVMYISAPELMGLMTPVAEIRDLGAQCLRIEAFAEPMFAASIVTYSVCVGAGDTLKPAIINLCSMWFVRLSLAALLARNYGLQGVWTAMAIELTFRGVLFLIRLFRGRWMKTLSA